MTDQMILIPAADWVDVWDRLESYETEDSEPEIEVTPATTHAYEPYRASLFTDTVCGRLGCGGSITNPIHFT